MKLETSKVYLVDLGDDGERHVFFDKEEVGDFLLENMSEPKEKFKKVVKGEKVDGPTIVKINIPSDLEDEEYRFGKRPFRIYLADAILE
ncbi:hypothetical protein AKJ37_02515 [candidate division MSBL1 archaeon SCGC-AAA259I09]|uniref:Uncharacterized protein n=2 Tax=candidate division MSBL1 TaxID=215777 RepID=A0A133UU16_9EURY|nr:hypothetical protein AKJ37_02515 [candidate division MSBL1 archaeon SCGC-AAA259I09]KXB08662.1 hypothetical protein AKJ55_00540 [candidate division MSBL1 archaeon SCGC-AAA382M17]